jgi:starvation-inducible outer membrane lipoprotein
MKMGIISLKNIRKILFFGFVLALSGCGMSGKNSVQTSQEGLTQAYLGCLMYSSDILKCQDLRWGAMLALSNRQKQTTVTIEDLDKATPVK